MTQDPTQDPIRSRIEEIEKEIRKTPYNKATQKHIGMLKARLACLRQQQETERTKKRGKKGLGFGIRKSGDATVLLIGPPSVGKSTLLNALTNAASPIADYNFTTLCVIAGMMLYNGARIQILDIPGLITGASSGKGRGREILSVARAADLLCLMLDASKNYSTQIKIIKKELYDAGFRLNETPPDIKLYKRPSGGISITTPSKKKSLPDDTIKKILREFNILNAELIIRQDISLDQLVDFLAANRAYMPFISVVNKTDILQNKPKDTGNMIFISAKKKENLDTLRQNIWKKLNLMRIYLKKIGKKPDMKEPLIMKKGSTVREVCLKLHKEFLENFDSARLWGESAKFPGQKTGLYHRLNDKDVLEIRVK